MKRIVSVVLFLALFCSLPVSAAEEKNIFPVKDPAVFMIAAAVDNEIDRIYDETGRKSVLYFAFSPEGYQSLEEFREAMRRDVWPLMNAMYSADMSGRDYITVRSSYGVHTQDGRATEYYYVVTLRVYGNKDLRRAMDKILKKVQGDTPAEKLEWLQSYLHNHIEYDEDTLSSSGTQLALMEGRGVCMGYTRSMMELCRRLDIPCFCVINETHMWNSVMVEGRWQMLDVTWDIPLCEVIEDDNHTYDISLYRKCINYFQNIVYYKGRAAALLMEDLTQTWYRPAAEYVLGAGIFKGTTLTRFAPNAAMTRGMFVTVLGRLAGATGNYDHGFEDVPRKQYYAPYVGWAKESGIVKGVTLTRFAPDTPVTREQLCKMMAAFAAQQGTPLADPTEQTFVDDALISRWARRSVYQCAAAGLVQGKGKNCFDPQSSATRAEVAVILLNYHKFTKSSESV